MNRAFDKTFFLASRRLSIFRKKLKKDFNFHNQYTEILAIWTFLFFSLLGIFFLAVNSNMIYMPLYFLASIALMLGGIFIATSYLYILKKDKETFFHKLHGIFNKSFKLRGLLQFVRMPNFSIAAGLAKNFMSAIKHNFKLTS